MPHRWIAPYWSLLPSAITGSSAGSELAQLGERGVEVVERLQRRGVDRRPRPASSCSRTRRRTGRSGRRPRACPRRTSRRRRLHVNCCSVSGVKESVPAVRLRVLGRAGGSGPPSRARRRAGSPGSRRTRPAGCRPRRRAWTCLIQLAKSRNEIFDGDVRVLLLELLAQRLDGVARTARALGRDTVSVTGPRSSNPSVLTCVGRRPGGLVTWLVLARRPAAPGDGDRQRERQGPRGASISSLLLSLSR